MKSVAKDFPVGQRTGTARSGSWPGIGVTVSRTSGSLGRWIHVSEPGRGLLACLGLLSALRRHLCRPRVCGTHWRNIRWSTLFALCIWLTSVEAMQAAAPSFSNGILAPAPAEVEHPYYGTLVSEASDPDGDSLIFSKGGGPAWLSVAGDGTLYGMPLEFDVGLSTFSVGVTDGTSSDFALLEIEVNPSTSDMTLFDVIEEPFVLDPNQHPFYQRALNFLTQTQYLDLWNYTSGNLPTGKRVVVAQVENDHADPSRFPTKTFIPHPVGAGTGSHASSVGGTLYGGEIDLTSNARVYFGFSSGIPAVHSFTSSAFRTDVLKLEPGNANARQPGGVLPSFEAPLHLINVSNTAGSGLHSNNVRAMDYLIETHDILAVTSMPGSLSDNSSLSGVLWNALVVGKPTTDLAYPGGTEYENVEAQKRDKPDMVSIGCVPSSCGALASSWAVPAVASGAAMLLDYAMGDPSKVQALHSVVMKSILMAGARKEFLASPLYDTFGDLIGATFDPPYVWASEPPLRPL